MRTTRMLIQTRFPTCTARRISISRISTCNSIIVTKPCIHSSIIWYPSSPHAFPIYHYRHAPSPAASLCCAVLF
jgi:hypothetical protein